MLRIEDILQPGDLHEALNDLDRNPGLKPIAGGTDLMVQLSESGMRTTLLDLSKIKELHELKIEGDLLFIGAAVSHAEIAKSEIVRANAPLIAKSSSIMGGPAIRNRATIGGNIGNASPVAESFPTLIAHGAEIILVNAGGSRNMPVEDFHLGPGKNALERGELILGFEIPIISENFFGFYERLGSREALTITKVGVALASKKKGNQLHDVRISLSAVAPRAIRAPEAEKLLESSEITFESIDEVAEVLVTECTPITDFRSTCEYRGDMVGQLFRIGMQDFFQE